MTSGHSNANYGSGRHSNGIGHSNTSGSLGHGNTGSHTVTWELSNAHNNTSSHSQHSNSTADFPLNSCEGSLTKLYEKSEQIRDQYNSVSKKNTSSLLPTKPDTIVLGSTDSSDSLLYKLLDNARNQGSSQILATNYKISTTYNTKPNYHSQWAGGAGGHTNSHTNTGHQSHANVSRTGDINNSGNTSVTVAGNATYSLANRFNAWSTSGIISAAGSISGNTGSVALKSTLDALWTLFGKYCVTNSVVNTTTLSPGTINNYRSGHSSYSAYSDDYSKREYKTNIKRFDGNALDDINKIDIVKFNYKPEYGDPTIDRVGFIANDTDEIFSTRYHDRMDYMNCIGMLLKSVQELSAKVDKLEAELKEKNNEHN